MAREFKQNAKKGIGTERPREEAPAEPKVRRLIINDATFETLHQAMADNPVALSSYGTSLPDG
jgi:hypothetical protein